MPIMNPRLSLNGDTAKTLVEDRQKAMTALKDALDAMTALQPHGRNYVGKDHQFSIDRALHKERQQRLIEIHDDLLLEAFSIKEKDQNDNG